MMAGLTEGVLWGEIAAILCADAHVKHGDILMAFLLSRSMLDNVTFDFGICEDQMELDWVTSTGIEELVVKCMANALEIPVIGKCNLEMDESKLEKRLPPPTFTKLLLDPDDDKKT